MKEHDKKRYILQKESMFIKTKKYREETILWLKEFKSKLVCFKCPENDPCCLDFHHVFNKKFNIANMARQGYSKEKILEEIKKCIVLCANCHRKIHK